MDDKFGYLFLALSFLLFWTLFYFIRKDLRRKLRRVGLFGGLIGPVAEYWNYKDYWHPPSLMGNELVFIEDIIIGVTVTGISAVVYDIFFKTTDEVYVPNTKKMFGIMFILSIIALIVFVGLGYNSVFVSSITLPILTAFMLYKRPDLLKVAFWTTSIVLVIMLIVYHILFNVLFSNFWDKYWLLKDTKYGVTVCGNIAITEIIWYLTWSSFAGIAYNFASGKKKVKLIVQKS